MDQDRKKCLVGIKLVGFIMLRFENRRFGGKVLEICL